MTSIHRRLAKPRPTVAVWGHYHGGNLGDELVVDTIVDAIRRRRPGAEIVGISMSPNDTCERHGIVTYPINPESDSGGAPLPGSTGARPADLPGKALLQEVARRAPGARRLRALLRQIRMLGREPRFLLQSYRTLHGIDVIVVAGSGQLLDEWSGPWLHPYTLFRWAVLARAARVPMLYLSVGAGPIDSRLSALFIRVAVACGSYVSVRDGHSARLLSSIGASGPPPVYPDMGYGYSDDRLDVERRTPAKRRSGTVVGLNPMAHQDPRYWPRGDARRYDAYLRKLTAFTRWLLDYGYTVRLFSSQPRSDSRVVDDLVRLLTDNGTVDPQRLHSELDKIEHVRDLTQVIAGCDRVVAGRYHSLVLPLLLDIPVLGLAYNPKTTELFADVGRPEQCLNIDSFSVESLIDAFRELSRQEQPLSRERLRARVDAHRAKVEEQFDLIFGEVSNRDQRPAEAVGS